MKRGFAILVSLCALAIVAYFTMSEWAIRHETLTFYDASRDNRPVAVDIAVRWDKEMQAKRRHDQAAGGGPQPRQTLSNSPSTLSWRTSCMRGFMAISIQHDLPTDARW